MKKTSRFTITILIINFILASSIFVKLINVSYNCNHGERDFPRSPAIFFSALTRTNPINIQNDTAFATYAAYGDGSEGDPWVIQDYLLELNYSTTHGIIINNTRDYCIFRRIFINETRSLYTSILTYNASNIEMYNVNVTNSSNGLTTLITFESDFHDFIFDNMSETTVYCESSWEVNYTGFDLANGLSNGFVFGNQYYTGNSSRDIWINNISTEMIYDEFNPTIHLNINQSKGNEYFYIANWSMENGTDGIELRGDYLYLDNISITNIVDDFIFFVNNDNSMISNCQFHGNGLNDYGIRNFLSTTNDDNNSFVNNTFNDIANPISFNNDSGLIINGNEFYNINGTVINLLECNDSIIDDNIIYNNSNIDYNLKINDCNNFTISDNLISGNGSLTQANIYLKGSIFNVENNTILDSKTRGIHCENVINTSIDDNTMIDCDYSADRENAFIFVENSNNVNITGNDIANSIKSNSLARKGIYINSNNQKINIIDNSIRNISYYSLSYRGTGIFIDNTDNITIEGNYLDNRINIDLRANSENSTITGNYFENAIERHLHLIPDSTEIDGNYWKDYFEIYPYAITDKSLTYLEFDYNGTGIDRNDEKPRYNPDWYVGDQNFFDFFSSIDFFGVSSDWIKIYINDERVTRDDPVIDSNIYRVTIKDFANQTMHDVVYNINTTIYHEIPLRIVWVVIANDYNHSIIVYLTKGEITTSFTLPGGSEIERRLALGEYEIVVENPRGDILNETTWDIDENDKSTFSISFGFTTLAILDPNVTVVTGESILTYTIIIIIAALMIIPLFAITSIISRRSRKRSRSSRSGIL